MKGMVTVLAPDNQQVRTGTWALLVFVDSTRVLWGRHLRMRCERCTRMCSRCTEYLLLTAWGAQRRKVLPRLQSYVGLASRKTLPLVVSRESDNVRGAEAQRELFFFFKLGKLQSSRRVGRKATPRLYWPCLLPVIYPVFFLFATEPKEAALATNPVHLRPTPLHRIIPS